MPVPFSAAPPILPTPPQRYDPEEQAQFRRELERAIRDTKENNEYPALYAEIYDSGGAVVNVKHPKFGAKGDGVTDDTAAIREASAALVSGQKLLFPPGSYLISFTNAGDQDDFGRKVIFLSGKSDITIQGEGATIKINNHDCSLGGLMWLWGIGCQRVTVDGFYFDMTFTGVNTSASLYPFCGAIIFPDAATGAQTQSQICSDITVRNCIFKLFHPYGSWANSGAPYAGDANNGFKVFSAFVSGDYLATAYANQNRNATFENLTFREGHNGYGVWVWAYNHVVCRNLRAEAWVSKYSNNAGVIQGAGVSMIRYHQWHNTGIDVSGCHFRARPCDDRATDFQGEGSFCNFNTNLTGDYDHGQCIARDNEIILGNGDAANTLIDYGVRHSCYGDFVLESNIFDGITTATNAYNGICATHKPEVNGGDGKSTWLANGNTFGVHGSYNDCMILGNGSSASETKRRCKALVVTNNISFSQSQYLLNMDGNSEATYLGCRHSIIEDNICIGTHNTVFGPGSTNSSAIKLAANVATDMLICRRNIIKDKYYALNATNVHADALVQVGDNLLSGITTDILGGSLPTQEGFGGTIASAGTITLPPSGDTFFISGTTNITSVTASRNGRKVTLVFLGILTFTDGSNLLLAGNFVTTNADSIDLWCDGTNWIERCRSVN